MKNLVSFPAAVVIALITAEALAVATYWARHDQLYYVRPGPAETAAYYPVVHPYFGFVHVVRDHPTRTNNHGFVYPEGAAVDYPYNGPETLIAVFGGSVAQGFALNAIATRGLDALSDGPVRILNFAGTAYKQPQQLLVLEYFLSLGQRFDVIVNLDGFNEVALTRQNSAVGLSFSTDDHPSFPSPVQWGALTGGSPNSLAAVLAQAARRCPVAACWLAVSGLASLTASDAPFRFFSPAKDRVSAIDIWLNGSRRMASVADSIGARYLHVLQPNRHHPNGDPVIAAAYEDLREGIATLEAEGIDAVDGTGLEIPDSLYSDSCCHLTPEGHARIMALVRRSYREAR